MNNSGASPSKVLAHEDQAAFDRLLESYRSEFQPSTTHETFLTDQLAQSRWRLDRFRRLESVALENIVSGEIDETNPDTRIVAALGSNPLILLNRWAASAEKSYFQAYRELSHCRSREKRNEANDAKTWLKEQLQAMPPRSYRDEWANFQNEANLAGNPDEGQFDSPSGLDFPSQTC